MMKASSDEGQDHDQPQLSSRLGFGRFNAGSSQAGTGQRATARQFLPVLLLLAIVVATAFRRLIIHRHDVNTPAGLDGATDGHTKAIGSNDPHTDTGQRAARQFPPVLLLLAIVVAAGFGDFIIHWHNSDTPDSKLFVSTAQYGEWAAIVSVVAGVSVAIASSTWPRFLRVAKDAGPRAVASAVTIYLLISAVAVVGPFLVEGRGDASFELSHFYWRIGVLAALIICAGAGSFCGLVLLWYSQRACDDDARAAAGTAIPAILSARNDLQRFFVGATILITGTVIMIGGLQSALNAYAKAFREAISTDATGKQVNISVGALILYGVFFAALLAVVLIPAYMAWQNRATSFRNHLFPIPEDGRPPQNWYERRSDLEGLLGMNLGSTSRFLAITGVLAPLIGTIITVIIPAVHG